MPLVRIDLRKGKVTNWGTPSPDGTSYVRKPAVMSPESLDFAVQNYFAVM